MILLIAMDRYVYVYNTILIKYLDLLSSLFELFWEEMF